MGSGSTTPAPPTPGYVTYGRPDPQCVLGLNSAFVYGENVAGVLGLNNSMVIGSNSSLLINPLVLMEMSGVDVASSIAQVCGGFAGGCVGLTIGTNSAITAGRQIAAAIGGDPTTYSIDMAAAGVSMKICLGLISLTALTWFIAYAAEQDENARATMVATFQSLMDVFEAALMAMVQTHGATQGTATVAAATLFSSNHFTGATSRLGRIAQWALKGVTFGAAGIEAVLMPTLSSALEENHFASQTESYQQQQATQSA